MMKRHNRLSKWVALAVTGLGGVSLVAMVVAMMAVTGVSLVTPDTAFAKFDLKNLTVVCPFLHLLCLWLCTNAALWLNNLDRGPYRNSNTHIKLISCQE